MRDGHSGEKEEVDNREGRIKSHGGKIQMDRETDRQTDRYTHMGGGAGCQQTSYSMSYF